MNSRANQLAALDRLLTIMDELRLQCPLDRKQTMETLRHLTIEETYELGDAILDNDLDEVKKELGDVFVFRTTCTEETEEHETRISKTWKYEDYEITLTEHYETKDIKLSE